jgi:hypothetical protein
MPPTEMSHNGNMTVPKLILFLHKYKYKRTSKMKNANENVPVLIPNFRDLWKRGKYSERSVLSDEPVL